MKPVFGRDEHGFTVISGTRSEGDQHRDFDEIGIPVEAAPVAPEVPVQFEPVRLIPDLLRTVAGVSSEPEFVAEKAHINVGRERDVVDAQGRAVRRIDVPGHAPRGVLLLPGDEIYLGRARIRLEIHRG